MFAIKIMVGMAMNKQQLEQAGNDGDLEARFTLANAYFYGDEELGIDPDPIEAMLWYDMAAQLGHKGAIEALFAHAVSAQKSFDAGETNNPDTIGVAMYLQIAVEYAEQFEHPLPGRTSVDVHVEDDQDFSEPTVG